MKLGFYTMFLLSFFTLKVTAAEQKPFFESFWAVSVRERATIDDIFNERVNVINWLCGGSRSSMILNGEETEFWLKGRPYDVASDLETLDDFGFLVKELKSYGNYRDPVFVFRESSLEEDKKLWIDGVIISDPKILKATASLSYRKADGRAYIEAGSFALFARALQSLKRASMRDKVSDSLRRSFVEACHSER